MFVCFLCLLCGVFTCFLGGMSLDCAVFVICVFFVSGYVFLPCGIVIFDGGCRLYFLLRSCCRFRIRAVIVRCMAEALNIRAW